MIIPGCTGSTGGMGSECPTVSQLKTFYSDCTTFGDGSPILMTKTSRVALTTIRLSARLDCVSSKKSVGLGKCKVSLAFAPYYKDFSIVLKSAARTE